MFFIHEIPSHYTITSNELQSLYLSTKCALERKWSWTHVKWTVITPSGCVTSVSCRNSITPLARRTSAILTCDLPLNTPDQEESDDIEWQARCCFSFPNWFHLIGVDRKCDRCNDFFLAYLLLLWTCFKMSFWWLLWFWFLLDLWF